jgi:release factor glutamine methyltransferase
VTTIGAALQEATSYLRIVSPTARLDAELLLAHVLRTTRTQLIARLDEPLAKRASEHLSELVIRRAELEPVAYLVGEREFYGLPLYVDPRVLVPRPETELLVELALAASARLPGDYALEVADIGTGSGAIAIAVAANLPHAHVWAVDLSEAALEVARANVERHGLGDRITLLQGDGLQPLPEPVDLLLSNPPYTMLETIDENVRRYEPHLALDGGSGGLQVIREILATAPRYLKGSTLLMEIGAWQGQAVKALAAASFPGAAITIHRDLAGLDRVLEVERQVQGSGC